MRITVALAALLMSSAAAFADDMQDCRSNDPVRAIGACSLVLQTKTESKPTQVTALGYRALAYMRKGGVPSMIRVRQLLDARRGGS